MSTLADSVETVLIVDDEESVRRTFRDWLSEANLPARILTAADAEAALVFANEQPIDLAILDWNLGAGNDGLRLLEDLYVFNPDVVAIMITGFAHQATPLNAMRMGVRDYLDKNQDLDRDSFLAAVRRQLERIRPARRERHLHQTLVAFRESVEKVLPIVQAAAAINDPVPLPEAIGGLFRFLQEVTAAADGVLLVRAHDRHRQPSETIRVYDMNGTTLSTEDMIPFSRSVAGAVLSLQRPRVLERLSNDAGESAVELQPFERGHDSLLAIPLQVAAGVQAVLELFDKTTGTFTEVDQRLAAAVADFGTELLRHALAERQTQRILFDAVAAALTASETVTASLQTHGDDPHTMPPPDAVLNRLREGLRTASGAAVAAEDSVRLAEAIRVLAIRHGPEAVRHCCQSIDSLRHLLDSVTRS